jgi:hypothetical protein
MTKQEKSAATKLRREELRKLCLQLTGAVLMLKK